MPLNLAEILIRDYVRKLGVVSEVDEINFTAGRSRQGFTADIEIGKVKHVARSAGFTPAVVPAIGEGCEDGACAFDAPVQSAEPVNGSNPLEEHLKPQAEPQEDLESAEADAGDSVEEADDTTAESLFG